MCGCLVIHGQVMEQAYKRYCYCCLVAKSCLTICDLMECSPPGSSLSMGFLRQEYWSGLPFPSPGDLPSPGIKPVSPALAGGFFITEPSRKPTKDISKRSILGYNSDLPTLALDKTHSTQLPLVFLLAMSHHCHF